MAPTSPSPLALEVVGAKGVFLIDATGKKYFDLISGISVSNLGHGRPEIIAAIKAQLDRHLHVMVYGEFIQHPQVRLAEALCKLLPASLDSVFFVNSGSEAVEGALKLAKRYTGRHEIVAFKNAYHGSSHGALSVMGDEKLKIRFRPLLPSVRFLEFNNTADLDKITRSTACVIIEPVQGEAGVIPAEKSFLEALREKCSDTGTLLIFDEIQTGLGRTGTLFAFENYGVVPDILLLAKALGGGMPLGAFIASKEIMSCLSHNPSLGHITTFGGHPVSCAAALAHLQVIRNEKIHEKVKVKSGVFSAIIGQSDKVSEIRSAGLLMAVQFESEDFAMKVIKRCFNKGVITDWFLFRPDALRIAPPLTITLEEAEIAATRIREAIDEQG
ncbi:MAG: aspartate aminotransferase family protein [Bacteroidales bacterium]|nr:aspartate aminotransferase family protein [Bacteroidales bacterium]